LPPFFTEENFAALIPFEAELMEFFKRVSLSLWQLDQQHFPENAHYFSSTLSRIIDNLTLADSNHSEIISCLDKLAIGSMDIDAPFLELDIMVVKLTKMCHLKKTYNFISSYESFHVIISLFCILTLLEFDC
jgi:hypothetical protein